MTTTPPPPEPATRERYVLRLYVAGTSPRSIRAIAHARALCERRLAGCHELTIIDLYQAPERAALDQIVAAPTLLKLAPAPPRAILGDLSDERRLLEALDLAPDAASA